MPSFSSPITQRGFEKLDVDVISQVSTRLVSQFFAVGLLLVRWRAMPSLLSGLSAEV